MKPPKQYSAAVYQQRQPRPNGRQFRLDSGDIYPDHDANLERVATVKGTYEQCWAEAKAYVDYPVVEFKEVNHGNV